MEWKLTDIEGKELKTIKLSNEVFAQPMNEAVLYQVVKAYQANKRQGSHATKTRSLISGSGKKPFKQKGTGNARQGSSRSPLMEGGAVVHGPQPRDYTQAINKKVRQLAIKIALSEKAKHKQLFVVDKATMTDYSTKKAASMIQNLIPEHNVLIVDGDNNKFFSKSVKNIYKVDTVPVAEVNASHVLGRTSLLCTESGLKELTKRLEGKN